MKTILLPLTAAIALTGCASIFSGTTTNVSLRSTPGAHYNVTNAYGQRVSDGIVSDDSNVTINLERSAGYFSPQAYSVKFAKPGYRPKTIPIDPAINPLYFGNILIGGFVGMIIVDPLTGAMFRQVPRDDNAELVATGEDMAALDKRERIITQAKAYPVSRHEYSGREVARAANCTPIANPQVINSMVGEETLIFSCEGGSSVSTVCRTTTGCR